MKDKLLKQRFDLLDYLKHNLRIENYEKVKILQEEIKNLDLIINNLNK